jgi:hypothetical protein
VFQPLARGRVRAGHGCDYARFVYRRALLQQSKGWGKSPIGAALALFEFAGPSLPDGIDARGEAVGHPWGAGGAPPPWVQIAAFRRTRPFERRVRA